MFLSALATFTRAFCSLHVDAVAISALRAASRDLTNRNNYLMKSANQDSVIFHKRFFFRAFFISSLILTSMLSLVRSND